jgi:hypothetical protein
MLATRAAVNSSGNNGSNPKASFKLAGLTVLSLVVYATVTKLLYLNNS